MAEGSAAPKRAPFLLEVWQSPEGTRARAEIEDGPFRLRIEAIEEAPERWQVKLEDCAGSAPLMREQRQVRGAVQALALQVDEWATIWRDEPQALFTGLGRT